MSRLFVVIFALFIMLPAFADDRTVIINNKAILYMYTKDCGYCNKFVPIYDKLQQIYSKKCTFLKQDASTEYGTSLMNEFKASYVPFVALIDYKKHTIQRVAPVCLLNYACVKDSVDKFVAQ